MTTPSQGPTGSAPRQPEIAEVAEIADSMRPQAVALLAPTADIAAPDKIKDSALPLEMTEEIKAKLDAIQNHHFGLTPEEQRLCPWPTLKERLLANNGEKLSLAERMPGGSELVGVDKNGKAMFKNTGLEPVMYGRDEAGDVLKIAGRNPEEMRKVKTWLNFFEIKKIVEDDGYELFPFIDGEDGMQPGEEILKTQSNLRLPFVASRDLSERRCTWVIDQDKPEKFAQAFYHPGIRGTRLHKVGPDYEKEITGAALLLRV